MSDFHGPCRIHSVTFLLPGFLLPKSLTTSPPLRVMRTLAGIRAKTVERADEIEKTVAATWHSELLEPTTNETAKTAKAWIFSLGFKELGIVPIRLTDEVKDVFSVKAVEDMIAELKEEGVLETNRVSITDVAEVDENTLSITINLLD